MTDSDDLHSIAKEANEVVRIERISHHIQRIREDQHAMRAAIERMSEVVTRLALVEERMVTASAAQERAFKALAEMEKKVVEIEKILAAQIKTTSWMDRGIWAALAALGVYILKKVGLL